MQIAETRAKNSIVEKIVISQPRRFEIILTRIFRKRNSWKQGKLAFNDSL
jgi:hypothetical protein